MNRLAVLNFALLSLMLVATNSLLAKDITICRQGQFPVGGTTIQREGTFNPDTFVGWAE